MNQMNPVAVLLMVKNEEDAIQSTIPSISLFQHLFVLDTGSTDNTIPSLTSLTKQHNLTLHLKSSTFISFPHSRNEAIEFAENICKKKLKHIKYLLLIDAADVFKTNIDIYTFIQNINSIPQDIAFGIVKQSWLDKGNMLSDHFDIRFISIKHKLRYDTSIPVHEQIQNAHLYKSLNFADMFYLYQDRAKFAASTERRFDRDIELLSKAKPTKRNLYFLAQSYMSINDFKNGFKYNVLSYETKDPLTNTDFDEKFTIIRIAFCAKQIKLSTKIIEKYLYLALSLKEPPVDAYVYIFQLYIENKTPELALPYIHEFFYLQKPSATSSTQLCNHLFYDYTRFHLISVISLMTKQHLDIGKMACLMAIKQANKDIDKNNFNLFA
jgi:hypothetical protein